MSVHPPDTSLVLDVMLGKLATYLRMCGYDTAYALELGMERDDELLEFAEDSGRVLVTRDRALAVAAGDAVLLTALDIDDQLAEFAAAGFELRLGTPSRCSRCNGRLERESERASTPVGVPDSAVEPVWVCGACGQYYWRGSHWDDVKDRLGAE